MVTNGQGRYAMGVVERVEVELYPERIPAFLSSNTIAVEEKAFNMPCEFCPLFAGTVSRTGAYLPWKNRAQTAM